MSAYPFTPSHDKEQKEGEMGTGSRLAAVVIAVLALVAGLPLSAAGAERQGIDFGVGFQTLFNVSVRQLGSDTVRVEDETIGSIGGGIPGLFGGDAGVRVTWIVNLEENRGTASGSMNLASCSCADPFIWRGDFHGRLTPEGASGVLHMTADEDGDGRTDLRFSARWETPGPIDPTIGGFGGEGILVSGIVTS